MAKVKKYERVLSVKQAIEETRDVADMFADYSRDYHKMNEEDGASDYAKDFIALSLLCDYAERFLEVLGTDGSGMKSKCRFEVVLED